MKTYLPLYFSACLAVGSLVCAQTVAPATTVVSAGRPAVSTQQSDALIKLNPFDVKSEADNSYGALNSNSLTQFDAALKNVPVSADIFTEDFIRDVGVTNLEDLMLSYGAGAGTVMSNPEADALNQQPGDRVGNQTMGIRGVVNPTALNGAHLGPAGTKNQWVNLDRTTRGIEVILTANPTRNWKVRLAATTSDGQNLTDKKCPLLFTSIP